jgi:RNA polymerase sigma-70 factor, ECF subfamily
MANPPSVPSVLQDTSLDALLAHWRPKQWLQLQRYPLSQEDKEDALQNAQMAMATKIHTFSGSSQISTWIFRVTMNEALMIMRKNRKSLHTTSDHDFNDFTEMPDALIEIPKEYQGEDDRIPRLSVLLEQLAPHEKECLVLKHTHNLSNGQIAHQLGKSEPAVRSFMFRARKRLKAALTQENTP